MMSIIKIIFSHTYALPPFLITCDLTIHKYKRVTEKKTATDSYSQIFTSFGFS